MRGSSNTNKRQTGFTFTNCNTCRFCYYKCSEVLLMTCFIFITNTYILYKFKFLATHLNIQKLSLSNRRRIWAWNPPTVGLWSWYTDPIKNGLLNSVTKNGQLLLCRKFHAIRINAIDWLYSVCLNKIVQRLLEQNAR